MTFRELIDAFQWSDCLHSFFKLKFDSSTSGIKINKTLGKVPISFLESIINCVTYMSVRLCNPYGKGEVKTFLFEKSENATK